MNKELGLTNGGIRMQIQSVPKPHAVKSVVGLIILGLMLFGIVSYFPIYTHVLQEVLGLPVRESRSLALLLIIFIGLAGMLFHITIQYTGDIQDTPQSTGIKDKSLAYYFFFASLIFMLFLVTICLWGFQAILYYQFYTDIAQEKSLIPFALGAAAAFIAGIETLGFFWATHLTFDFITWVFVYAILIAPTYILAKIFRLLEKLFKAIPSKNSCKNRTQMTQI
ncbi:MAG: hypothetical protein AB1422_00635 [bacterium]